MGVIEPFQFPVFSRKEARPTLQERTTPASSGSQVVSSDGSAINVQAEESVVSAGRCESWWGCVKEREKLEMAKKSLADERVSRDAL